jgi:hypothetical protein
MEFVPCKTFGRIIERHKGDVPVRRLGCLDLFRSMAFSQLSWRCHNAALRFALKPTRPSCFTCAPPLRTRIPHFLIALDLRGAIPAFVHISGSKLYDVDMRNILLVDAGSFDIMDCGYLDIVLLYAMHQAGNFFFTRA